MRFLKKSAKKPSYDHKHRIKESSEIDPVVDELLANKTEQDRNLELEKLGIGEYNRTSKEAKKTEQLPKVSGGTIDYPDNYDIENEAYDRLLSDLDDRDPKKLRKRAAKYENIGDNARADKVYEQLSQSKIEAGRNKLSQRERDVLTRAIGRLREHEGGRELRERESQNRIDDFIEKNQKKKQLYKMLINQQHQIKSLTRVFKALASKMAVDPDILDEAVDTYNHVVNHPYNRRLAQNLLENRKQGEFIRVGNHGDGFDYDEDKLMEAEHGIAFWAGNNKLNGPDSPDYVIKNDLDLDSMYGIDSTPHKNRRKLSNEDLKDTSSAYRELTQEFNNKRKQGNKQSTPPKS